MADFNVLATNHTGFTLSDLDRTIAFFRDALGFRVTSHAPRDSKIVSQVTGVDGADMVIAYLQGPGHALEFIQYVGPADRGHVKPRPCDVGFVHVAFDVGDVDAAIAASELHGVVPVASPIALGAGPNKGGRIVYLRDPDGICVEYTEKPGAHG